MKYIFSVSGGAWTSAPMANSSADVNTFLGRYVQPEKCDIHTMNTLKEGSHKKVLTEAKFTKQALSDFFMRGFRSDRSDFWAQTICRCFLQPHTLYKDNNIGLKFRPELQCPIANGAI